MGQVKGQDRINQLQSLRFCAAFVVLFGHVLMEARQHGADGIPDWLYVLPWGNGVDIFFVISGFIIYHIGKDLPSGWRSASDFFIRRLIRVAPIYWLFTLLMIAVAVLMPRAVQNTDASLIASIKSFFFIPYGNEEMNIIRPVLSQGWTLVFEVFFYLLFSLAILVSKNSARLFVIIALLLGFVVWGEVPPPIAEIRFLATPLLLLFCLGLMLARVWSILPRHNGFVAMALLGVSLWILSTFGADYVELDLWARFWSRGVPSFLAVYAVLLWRSPARWVTNGLVPLLGDASYALYLSHPFVVNALLLVFSLSGLHVGGLFIALATIAAVIASVAVYYWIEKPALKAGNGLYLRSKLGIFLRRPAVTSDGSGAALSQT